MSIIHRAPRAPRCRPRPSRPKLLPVTCLPWCRWADGHPGLALTGDQTSTSGHPDLDIGTADVGAARPANRCRTD
jgi:hypothetical protein